MPDDNDEVYEFTIAEVRALYKLLEFQYISYDNKEGHDVANRILQIIRNYESELAGVPRQST